MNGDTTPALPHVNVDLANHEHPANRGQEWHYGPDRGLWTGGHPITAYKAADDEQPALCISGALDLTRDEVPHLVAWLTAIYHATDGETQP